MTSRTDLFKRLQGGDEEEAEELVPPTGVGLHEITERLYERDVEDLRRDRHLEAPHGARWHTSFHASSFPGSDQKACARKALYRMMGVPPDGPVDTALLSMGEAGSDIERRIVDRWHRAGILLTEPPESEHQTVFSDPDVWLTCALDAALDLRPEYNHVLPADVKSKDHAAVQQIASGKKPPDPSHVRQVLVQTYLCRKYHEEMMDEDRIWRADELESAPGELLPAEGGSLYYVSRQRPRTAVEVFIPYDEREIALGLARLRTWRAMFESDLLPPRDPDWRWTMDPCRYCDVKQSCRKDIFDEVEILSESNGVSLARETYSNYDPDLMRKAVLERWKDEE